MKTTKTVQVPATTREDNKWTCDTCGKGRGLLTCIYCKDDVCRVCAVEDPTEPWSDYPSYYCPRCWKLGEMYRKAIDDHEVRISVCNDEWKARCLEAKANAKDGEVDSPAT